MFPVASSLFPVFPGFDITAVTVASEILGLALRSTTRTANCPVCDWSSTQVHSRYSRTLADCSIHQRLLLLRITARKFVCANTLCGRQVFCERLTLAKPHARTTLALAELHCTLGLALGGQAGSRLAHTLAIPTSGDTLTRRVLAAVKEPEPRYRYVGVDDFAIRKGHTYGTILIDLERGRVIDLFEGRDGSALEAWLKAHPGVEIITRDRWSNYAEAATAGTPSATQVADRFHLVGNVRELVERLLDAHGAELDAAFADTSTPPPSSKSPDIPGENASPREATRVESPTLSPPDASPIETLCVVQRSRREARFEDVRQRRAEGQSIRGIAHELGMSYRTVVKYLRIERCPDWQAGQPRPTRVDRYRSLVDEFIQAGGRQAAKVLRRLREAGCRSSYDAVRRFFHRRLAAAGIVRTRANGRSPPKPKRPTARQLSFEDVRRAEKRTEDQQQHLLKLATIGGLADELKLVDDFLELVRGTSKSTLADWLTQAEQSSSSFIRSFAKSIRSDESAVAAAMTTAWSNGPTEGQVNRLKAIKRSMYGRAKMPLLKARVCGR